MAVHVVQGRDPWWAPLAVNILGGLWNDWQQREKNKKEAAYLGELAKMYNGMQDGQNDTAPAPAQDTGQGLLNTNMAVPDEYNADGWANTFHKTDTPLTQFDLDTAGLAPTAPATAATTAPINAWANALGNSGNTLTQFDTNTAGIVPSTAQTPATATIPNGATQGQGTARAPIMTPMDFYRAALELAGTKRFRMLNPDRVQAMLTPYMKLNEEARQEQLRNTAAEDYLSQTSGAGRINSVMGNVIRGITPESLGNTVFNQNKPTVSTVDAGGQIHFYNIDPITGMPINTWAVDRTLTPQEIATNAYNQDKLQAEIDKNNADRTLEYYKADQNNSQYQGTFRDADGVDWIVYRNGKREPISNARGISEQKKEVLKNNSTILTNIQSKRTELQKEKNAWILKGATSDSPAIKSIDEQIKSLDAQERRILQENNSIINSDSAGQQTQTNSQQSTNKPMPPVSQTPRWIGIDGTTYSEEYVEALVKKAEAGQLEGIRTREELYNDFLRRGITPIEGTVPPININHNNKTQANNILGNNGNEVLAADTNTNNSWIGDFFNIFGATPAYADENISSNNTTLAADTNTEAGIQRALGELNGQFGEQRWADWASGLNLRGITNRLGIENILEALPPVGQALTPAPINPNTQVFAPPVGQQPIPNYPTIPYAPPVGQQPSPSIGMKRITLPPYNPGTTPNPEGMVLASNRRTRPQHTYSGYYSGDTRNGGQYSSIINRHAKAQNVDPDLIAAIIQQESGGNGRAVSNKGAGGLMQLMPQTARGLGVTDVFDPEQNIAGGTKYVAQMLKRYNGNVEKALWAYNAGPGNADKGNLPDETKKYIPSVMARYKRLKGIAATTPNTSKRAKRRRRTRSRRKR